MDTRRLIRAQKSPKAGLVLSPASILRHRWPEELPETPIMDITSAASGFLAYQRPIRAGPTPSGLADGIRYRQGLKICALPRSEQPLIDQWESNSHIDSDVPLYRRFAQVVDNTSSCWTLVSLLHIRMSSEENKQTDTDPGHPSIVIGVKDGTEDAMAWKILSRVQGLLVELTLDLSVGVAVIHCNPTPSVINKPKDLPHGFSFEDTYSSHIYFGTHFGRSVGPVAGGSGSAGPLLRLDIPRNKDWQTKYLLITCHHVVSQSRYPIHTTAIPEPSSAIHCPSDPDHQRWLKYLEDELERMVNKPPGDISILRIKKEAGKDLYVEAQQMLDRYDNYIDSIRFSISMAQDFKRHLGNVFRTSGLGTTIDLDGRKYVQDWALVDLNEDRLEWMDDIHNKMPLQWDENSDGTPCRKIGRTTGQTIGGLCAISVQKAIYQCIDGELTVHGEAKMVVSPVTRPPFDKPWSAGGDSGSCVFNDQNKIAGVLWGGDKAPDWVNFGPEDEIAYLRASVRSDSVHFFAPMGAVLRDIESKLKEDLGEGIRISLLRDS